MGPRQFVAIATVAALAVTGSVTMGAGAAVAAPGTVIVLDPDDNVGSVVWPLGVAGTTYEELPLNMRLADEVKARLEDGCDTTVVVTRDSSQPIVSTNDRKQVALDANADLMVTLAFNAYAGRAWGYSSDDNGPLMYARPQDTGFATSMLTRIQQYTGRPENASALRAVVTAQGAPGMPWYGEYADLPFPYLHSETLFLDGNWDNAVIEQRFDLIADGVYAGILDQMNAQGIGCSAYPDPPSAEELSRLRNLGYQNFQKYGGDPVSMSTGNFVTSEATIELSGVGQQVIDATLHYNAQSGQDSQVGVGWSFAFGTRTQFYSDGSAAVFMDDGRTFVFEPDGDTSWADSVPEPPNLPPPDEIAALRDAGAANFAQYGGGDEMASGPNLALPRSRKAARAGNPAWLPRDDAFGALTAEGVTKVTWTSAKGDQVMVFEVNEDTGYGRLVSIQDRQGNTTTLGYDGDGTLFPRLASITDQAGQQVAVTSNDDGRITALRRPDGATWRLDYNGSGDLVDLHSPRGRHLQWAYDGDHRMTSQTGADGVTWLHNTYDDQSRVVEQTTSTGGKRTFVFDDTAQTTTYTDATGATTVYYWNDLKQVTKVVDALGNDATTEYLPNTLTSRETDPAGAATAYEYNDAGLPTKVTDPEGAATTMAYNASGDLVSTADQAGAGRTSTFEVNAQGLPVTTTNPDGSTVTYTYDGHGDVTSVTDELGQTTTMAYDGRGNVVSTTDPAGNTTTYAYDLANRLTSATDAVGNVTKYAYDSDDNLLSVDYPNGSQEKYVYDLNNQVTKYTDRRGAVTTYGYDTEMNLTALTLPDGGITAYTYDGENRLTSTTDAAGDKTTYTLDKLGRTVSTTDPLGNVTKTAYDKAGNVASETDAAGFVTTYARDKRGLVTKTTAPDEGVTMQAYDRVGRLAQVTDPRGGVTKYLYDWRDQIVQVTDPLGHTETSAYDKAGRLVSQTDKRGGTTQYAYDAAGNLIQQTDQAGAVTTYTYDAVGNQTTVTDPNGNTTTYGFDAMGNAISQTDPLGAVTTYAVDGGGLTTAVTDPNGATTTVAYDAMGQVTSVTDALSRVTATGWDKVGNRTSLTLPDGTTTRYGYDANHNLTSVVENATGGEQTATSDVTTRYTYDARNLLASITDANGAVTKFDYGSNGQVTKETDPLERVTAYAYDRTDNLTSRTAADGVITSYGYDLNGNLTGRSYTTGETEVFTYDPAGNQLTATNSAGKITNVYDAVGRLTQTTDVSGKKLAYAYDTAGNRTGLTLPDGKKVTYAYDAANHNTAITSPLGQVAITYDAAGRPVTTTRADGTVVTTGYTAADEIESLTTTKGTSSLASFAYTYTPNGYVASRTSKVGSQPTEAATYTYDPLGRLTASDGSALPSTYTYDPVGNRLQWTAVDDPTTDKPDDPFVQDNTYDDAGQLTTSVKTRQNGNATFTDTTSNTWGPTGNLVESDTQAQAPGQSSRTGYVYDAENRLLAYGSTVNSDATSGTCNGANPGIGNNGCPPGLNKVVGLTSGNNAATPSTTFVFPTPGAVASSADKTTVARTYDAMGRVATETYDKSTTTWTHDGLDPVVATVDGNGNQGSTDLYLRDAYGELLGQQTGKKSDVAWYVSDALRSIYATTSGQVGKTTTQYADYGHQIIDTDWQFGYGGERADQSDLGLVHYYARSYEPLHGTWVEADPYRGATESPVTLQRLHFVGHNPTSTIDILGYGFGDYLSYTWNQFQSTARTVWNGTKSAVSATYKAWTNVGNWAADKLEWVLPKGAIQCMTRNTFTNNPCGYGEWAWSLVDVVPLGPAKLCKIGAFCQKAGDALINNLTKSGSRYGGALNKSDLPKNAINNLTKDADYAFKRLNENHGLTRVEFNNQVHALKSKEGLPPDFDLEFGPTGDVWNPKTGDLIGTLVHGK